MPITVILLSLLCESMLSLENSCKRPFLMDKKWNTIWWGRRLELLPVYIGQMISSSLPYISTCKEMNKTGYFASKRNICQRASISNNGIQNKKETPQIAELARQTMQSFRHWNIGSAGDLPRRLTPSTLVILCFLFQNWILHLYHRNSPIYIYYSCINHFLYFYSISTTSTWARLSPSPSFLTPHPPTSLSFLLFCYFADPPPCWRCILVHLACSLHFGLDLIMELTRH
jgi:hypothetical protein